MVSSHHLSSITTPLFCPMAKWPKKQRERERERQREREEEERKREMEREREEREKGRELRLKRGYKRGREKAVPNMGEEKEE